MDEYYGYTVSGCCPHCKKYNSCHPIINEHGSKLKFCCSCHHTSNRNETIKQNCSGCLYMCEYINHNIYYFDRLIHKKESLSGWKNKIYCNTDNICWECYKKIYPWYSHLRVHNIILVIGLLYIIYLKLMGFVLE